MPEHTSPQPSKRARRPPGKLWLDETAAFRADPYRFISRRCEELQTDVFQTRIFLRRTVCMTGAEAARLFYDEERFLRAGASPEPLQATLLGKSGVQGLDGEAHRHRKQMFMSVMSRASVREIGGMALEQLRVHAKKWVSEGQPVVLYDELLDVLARAACQWAGVPIEEPFFTEHVRELAQLFDSAANSIRGHARSRVARKRSEHWAAGIIRSVRTHRLKITEDRALHAIAWHRGLDNELLTEHVAAVELLNLLRPITAVSVYIVLAAHALHHHASLSFSLSNGTERDLEGFALEVRRFYPFFPAVVARVRTDFEWQGFRFRAGSRAMLDIHGTHHDPRIWRDPEVFAPERFADWSGDPFTLIAQGGGDHFSGHRCAGEWITIELMKVAARFLAGELRYLVPPQDLSIDMAHLPALPVSRFVIRALTPR